MRESSRWIYTEGTLGGAPGCIAYDDDSKFHVHNDTSPARGQHNAFDLVRLHRFGHLDKECANGIPMRERPSYRAMAEMMATLPEIRAASANSASVPGFAGLGSDESRAATQPTTRQVGQRSFVIMFTEARACAARAGLYSGH